MAGFDFQIDAFKGLNLKFTHFEVFGDVGNPDNISNRCHDFA
jgi:hypothetical protein